MSNAKGVIYSSSHTPVHETELLVGSNEVSDSFSDVTLKEGIKESRDNPSKHHKVLCISSEPQEKKTSNAQIDKPDTIHASGHVVNHSNVKKALSNSCMKIKSEEKEEHNSIHALNAVVVKIEPGENAKLANAYENGSPDALRLAAGRDGRKTNSDSGLGAFRQADIEQNISRGGKAAWKCYFQKQKLEEPNVAQTNIMISSNLSSKKEGKKEPLEIDKVGETGLTSAELSVFSFLPVLQDHGENTASKLQRGERKPHSIGLQMTKISPDDKKSDLKASKSQKQQMQKGVEAGDLNRMVMKRLMQPVRLDSNNHGAVLRNSVLQPEKRRKNSISTIRTVKAEEFSVQMDCSNSPRTAFGRPVKDEPLTPNSYSVGDLGTKDVKLFLPVATDVTDLRRLKMNDLKAMAKQLNLTRYYKLKKDDLVELLTSRLRSR